MEHQRERLERRAALTLLFPVTAADEVPEVRTLVDVARHALRRAVVRLRQDEPADIALALVHAVEPTRLERRRRIHLHRISERRDRATRDRLARACACTAWRSPDRPDRSTSRSFKTRRP